MFEDARSVPRDSTMEADVVIVGAGAAGITLARALSDTNLRVLLLESGGLEEEAKTDDLRHGLDSGEPYPVDFCRLRFFGGTTNHWGGWCRPLDPWVFSRRPWVDDQGWPIDRTTLDPYYEQAAGVVELPTEPTGWQWGWDYWRQELKDEGVPPLLDGDVVEGAMFRLSPPTRFGTRYRADLKRAERVVTLLHANALELETNDSAQLVTGVRVGTLSGNRFRVTGRIVVVAVGGLDVPRLLLLSDTTRPKGLGNDHDLVGRYFMDHREGSVGTAEIATLPTAFLGGKLSLFASRRALMALTPEVLEREQLLAVAVGIDDTTKGVAPLVDKATGVTAAQVGTVQRALYGGKSHAVDVFIRAEPKPNRSSRVVLGDERDALGQRRLDLRYTRSASDDASIRRTLEILAQELGRTGEGQLRIAPEYTEQVDNAFLVGCHLMGTTRMADDPTRGVVDRDLKVHGIDNLYIASSSVFPTVGFSNPTLTIVALTLRLRDEIVARLAP
ncbi:MAG: GMC family oxidoreductase [Acidimicrobiia bacterium]|nr:GMC family oxidoreductase [Acidimicrobiia bacterium]